MRRFLEGFQNQVTRLASYLIFTKPDSWETRLDLGDMSQEACKRLFSPGSCFGDTFRIWDACPGKLIVWYPL